jgi:membrane fusion protein, multidrug efflux system
MSKALTWIGATVLSVAGLGLAYWLGSRGSAPTSPPGATAVAPSPGGATSPGKGAGGPPAVTVDAAIVKRVSLPSSITAVGSLRSDEAVVLRPEVSGRIAEIGFAEGKPIGKGSVVIRLDQSVQRAEFSQAEANLALANSRLERARDLHKKGFISSQALDEAESTFKVSQATQQLAAARLSKLDLRAPFDGVVGLRQVSVGDFVREGQDIVNLEKIDVLKVDFRVPEQFLKQLSVGQSLQINLDAIANRTFDGSVLAINPLLDANGRAVVLRAAIRNADQRLRPGMFARVRLLTKETQDTLVIPEQAIVAVGDEFFVFKIVDGRAVRTKVELGQRSTGVVEVAVGLKAEETVVAAGQPKLRDGGRVQLATLDGVAVKTASQTNAASPDAKPTSKQ